MSQASFLESLWHALEFNSKILVVLRAESKILVALVVLVVCYFLRGEWRVWRRNLPPGPYGMPIVGYIPFIKDAHWDLYNLGKKYGDVFSFKMGSETVIVFYGVEVIKEALTRPEFLGRPSKYHLKLVRDKSVFFVEDFRTWREQRLFILKSMKDLGLGKTQVEGDIMDEIRHFLDRLHGSNSAPMYLDEPLSPSMSNNICSLLFGKRFEYGDPDRMYLDKNLEKMQGAVNRFSTPVYFPWIIKIPLVSKLFEIDTAVKANINLKAFFKKVIKKHKDTFDSKNIRDFIDRYIIEQNSRMIKDPNTTFSDDTLTSTVSDLFSAGSETVRTSIRWCVYVLAAFPEHQDKVLEDILEVIGSERDPEFQDMQNMPFSHSFILEVMRWKTIIPSNVPHCALADTSIGGYDIPKNATVLFSLWHAHHDPKYWDEPDSFVPDRFISKDGKSVSKPSYFIPFGLGKRVCPGEPMAMMEMFLYFTSIVQKFEVVFPDGYKPTFLAKLKGTYRLEPYKILFLPRNRD